MVLLGAGASKHAGVPLAFEMTEALLRGLPQHSALLAFVVGALQFQKGIGGVAPLGEEHRVDIESLANALTLLADRHELESAPFISSWHPRLTELVAPLERRLPEPLRAPGRTGLAAVRYVLALDVQEHSEVYTAGAGDYLLPLLEPLASQRRLVVATLNYDPVFEVATGGAGIECDTGLETWLAHGLTCPPDEPRLFLLKLHGCVSWWFDENDRVVTPRPVPDRGPALLFGGRNKLTPRGPFLDLLSAFRQGLSRSRRLTAVGYSFRDPHINAYVIRWLEGDPERQLRIVTPSARWLFADSDQTRLPSLDGRLLPGFYHWEGRPPDPELPIRLPLPDQGEPVPPKQRRICSQVELVPLRVGEDSIDDLFAAAE
jgi:hypothetical protein